MADVTLIPLHSFWFKRSLVKSQQYLFIHLPQQNFANEGHFLACIEYPYKSWNDSHVSVNIDDDDVGLISFDSFFSFESNNVSKVQYKITW